MKQPITREQSKNRAARRPRLGSWHMITEQANKVRHTHVEPKQVQWRAFDIEPVRAMYIGYRYKFNGHLVVAEIWDDDSVSYGFIQGQSVEVWLFVINDRQNHIEVFPFEYPDFAEAEYQKELAAKKQFVFEYIIRDDNGKESIVSREDWLDSLDDDDETD